MKSELKFQIKKTQLHKNGETGSRQNMENANMIKPKKKLIFSPNYHHYIRFREHIVK